MKDDHQKYRNLLLLRCKDPLVWFSGAVLLIIAGSNTATKLADADSFGHELVWQDAVLTEFSSAVVIILMLPFVFALFDRYPLSRENWLRRMVPYIGISTAFSALHIAGMVAVRKLFWPYLFGGQYQFFGDVLHVSLYEYRKDAVAFLLLLLIAMLQRQVRQAQAAKKTAEPVRLKSGSTTLLLHPHEFLYAKSASNYAEIVTVTGEQLARITLTELEQALHSGGCDAVRIHRSVLVNRLAITETTPTAGGDVIVKVRSGQTLRASRRYKAKLEL